MSTRSSLVIARPKRPPPILVCRKCLKRSDEDRDIKRTLKAELKTRGKKRGEKRPRVVKADCFGICPKRAVVVASAATLSRGDYVLVAGSDQVGEAVAALKPE